MVGWHHRLDWREFEQALGVGDAQRGLVCCSPRGHNEPDTTERLNCLQKTCKANESRSLMLVYRHF